VRAVKVPVEAQGGLQMGRQQCVAVLTVFALIAAEQQAVPFEVAEALAHDFPDTPARGMGGHEQGPIPRVGGAREQALEVFDTHQLQQEPSSRTWGPVEVERIPAESRNIEKLEPTGDLGTGTPRAVVFDQSLVQVGTDLGRGQLVG
jgi:hypothetical protein